ncbi:RodZ domain-containing protein [Gallionella capsiferriformans]|nr:RodZ domain-containing protein [Gallionella capsiferriformans]
MMEPLAKNEPEQTGVPEQALASGTESQEAAVVEQASPSVGCILRTARESMGMSIDDVVVKIKLAPRQIIALEADDFQVLPETAFLRGFVRSYAKLLQLDAQPLLDALPGAVVVNTVQAKVEEPLPTEKTSRRQNINLLSAALLVTVLIAVFAAWQNSTPQQPVATIDLAASDVASLPMPDQVEMLVASEVSEVIDVAASSPVVAPVSMVMSASTVAAAKTVSALRLVFDKESWAEIKDQSGKVLARQVNAPGSELRVEGVAPYTMVIGHASAVHLFYGEKPVDLSSYVNAGSDVARVTLE